MILEFENEFSRTNYLVKHFLNFYLVQRHFYYIWIKNIGKKKKTLLKTYLFDVNLWF